MDRDTTSYLKRCTKDKNAGKQILSCSFGCKSYFGLCDPGSPVNIIHYGLYAKLLDEIAPCTLEPTDVIIKLADKTERKPCGILKDVNIIIGSLIYPIDIYVLMILEDKDCPIVFGTTFLYVVGAHIKKKSISMKWGDGMIKFPFSSILSKPYEEEAQDKEEQKLNQLGDSSPNTKDEFERVWVRPESLFEDGEKEEIEMIMDATPIVCSRLNKVYEVLERKGDEELPPPTLKPLPKGLRYDFIDNTETFPVIVNAILSGKEKATLLVVLSKHHKALGYSMKDVKGIHPSIYSHVIPIEERAKLATESQ